MDNENIRKIQNSELWKRITRHPAFRGSYVVHTEKQNQEHYCALWVFFNWHIDDRTIKQYWKEGRGMIRNEGLDCHELPIECYGKALVFS